MILKDLLILIWTPWNYEQTTYVVRIANQVCN